MFRSLLFNLYLIQLWLAVFCQQSFTFVNPSPASIIQCATVPIQWNGGVAPFSVFINTTNNSISNAESIEVTPSTDSSPSNVLVDFPSGTSFTVVIEDSSGKTAQSSVLTVVTSTNTNCLDDIVEPSPDNMASDSSTTTKKSTRIAIITGSILAALVIIVTLIVFLVIRLKRRRRRNYLTSRDHIIQTFGSETTGFDGDGDPSMISDPFVYKSKPVMKIGSNSRPATVELMVNLAPQGQVYGYRGNQVPSIRVIPPDENSSSRIPDDDMDQLASRMVAMMSAGRMTEQAWAPNRKHSPLTSH